MRSALIPVAAIALVASAHAAESKEQLAEKLLTVSGAEKMANDSIDSAMKAMSKQVGGTANLPAAMRPKMEAAFTRIGQLMKDEMGWAKMKPEMIRLYAEAYTEEEMRAAITFYTSPAGKSFAAKMTVVTQKSMEWGMRRGAALGPKIQKIMQEELTKPDAPAPENPAANAPAAAAESTTSPEAASESVETAPAETDTGAAK